MPPAVSLYSIAEFINLRQQCIFCDTPLITTLTSFSFARHKYGSPLISSLKDGKFQLNIARPDDGFQNGFIDVKTGALSFDKDLSSFTPYLDCFMAKNSFLDLRPHVELFCSNQNCGTDYYLSSEALSLSEVDRKEPIWSVDPLAVGWESFRTDTSVICNVWKEGLLFIYSIDDPETKALKFPALDFGKISKEKLLDKISIMKVFS